MDFCGKSVKFLYFFKGFLLWVLGNIVNVVFYLCYVIVLNKVRVFFVCFCMDLSLGRNFRDKLSDFWFVY